MAVTYDDVTSTLDVEFRSSEVYRFFMVPKRIMEGLVGARSAGRYFNDEIKDHYREQRLR